MGFSRAVIVGAGGIASYLWSPLGRLLSTLGPKEITVIDGDRFEVKNLERQDMRVVDTKEFKSDVLSRRIKESFPDLLVASVPKFITAYPSSQEDTIPVDDVIREGDLVFSCVDNHATRLLLSRKMQRLCNGVLVSCGNEKTTGNVYRYIRVGKTDITRPVERIHEELAKPTNSQRNPGDLSCEERALVRGGEQTLAANTMAASFAVVFASQLLAIQRDHFPVDIPSADISQVWRNAGKVTEVQFDVLTSTSVNYQFTAPTPRRVPQGESTL